MQKIFIDHALSHRLIKSADELAALSSVNSPESAAAIDTLLDNELADLRDVICLDPRQHAALISGLPFPAVNGPTPASWKGCRGEVRTWRFMLAIVASAVGRPFGWLGQQEGRLITDLVPTKGQEAQQVGASSSTPLTLHTEDAFHPRRSTHFALFGLRNPKKVGTTLAPCDQAWKRLDSDSRKILMTPGAVILPDDSYSDFDNSAPDSMTAVWERDHGLGLRFDPAYTDRSTGSRRWWQAYEKLAAALDSVTYSVPIAPGQLVIINNDTCVHGRVPFTADYNGTDRWMLRINMMEHNTQRLTTESAEPGYGQRIRCIDGQVL